MKKETKLWFDLAEEDFQDMEVMLQAKRYRGAVFFAQQSAEKMIKGYTVEKKDRIPRKSHNIELLLKEAGLKNNELEDADLEKLTLAYTRVRYTDLSQVHYRTKEQTQEILKVAKKLYLWVKNKLINN